MTMTTPLLDMEGVHKRFVLHLQNQTVLDVLCDFSLRVLPGECVRLSGPSGMGKSTVLKLAFGNYQASAGRIALRAADGTLVDITQASPRQIVQLRASAVGYVSQFLRVIPRVSALDVVAEPLLERGPDGHPLMELDAARAAGARGGAEGGARREAALWRARAARGARHPRRAVRGDDFRIDFDALSL